MEMVFIATSDTSGACDASLRAGAPGFLRVLDDRTLAYPEYRGNGVMAGLGNLSENPHIGLLMIDFVKDLIGLHINGRAHILDNDSFSARYPGDADREPTPGRPAERWVVVEVTEAYIHCRKHIPRMQRLRRGAHRGVPARELDEPHPRHDRGQRRPHRRPHREDDSGGTSGPFDDRTCPRRRDRPTTCWSGPSCGGPPPPGPRRRQGDNRNGRSQTIRERPFCRSMHPIRGRLGRSLSRSSSRPGREPSPPGCRSCAASSPA